jgi:hypothetical protein
MLYTENARARGFASDEEEEKDEGAVVGLPMMSTSPTQKGMLRQMSAICF